MDTRRADSNAAREVTTPGYPHFHKDRVNLTIHIVMVPVFVAGVVGAVWSAGLARRTQAAAHLCESRCASATDRPRSFIHRRLAGASGGGGSGSCPSCGDGGDGLAAAAAAAPG